MRRPLLRAGVMALLATAAAVPAHAQRSRVIRQAFEPAITPFIGAAGFGERTIGQGLDAGARYDFNNGIAFGVQAERPLTRRTGLMGTVALVPFSRVNATRSDAVAELDRAVVAGLDVGIAGRLKPAAPLFVYVGGGGVFSTRHAAGETEGTSFDPRASAGLGLDFMRHERTGVRLLYIAHWTFASTPDAARWQAQSSVYDQTIVLGGRYALGWGREEQ